MFDILVVFSLPCLHFKTSHLLHYKDKQYDAGSYASRGLWGQNLSHERKNMNFHGKLGYRVPTNYINYSSISESAVFDNWNYRFFPKFSSSLRSGTYVFLFNIKSWNFWALKIGIQLSTRSPWTNSMRGPDMTQSMSGWVASCDTSLLYIVCIFTS